jgi:hypothetical protein
MKNGDQGGGDNSMQKMLAGACVKVFARAVGSVDVVVAADVFTAFYLLLKMVMASPDRKSW